MKTLWQAWETAGLSERILTFEGSYNARFIRGSRTKLSNHPFGSAFDINARWNGLGAFPALEGQEGSVRELINIANEHGFFWGGHIQVQIRRNALRGGETGVVSQRNDLARWDRK